MDTDNCNCLFNSPPVIANDVIVYGPAGGELFAKGGVYGISAETGEILWEFERREITQIVGWLSIEKRVEVFLDAWYF